MSDFSWDYVTRTASEALVELGRSVSATIAQAVEPGIYLIDPDVVYEVKTEAGESVVTRNGVLVAGSAATPTDQTLAVIAAEMAGVMTTIDVRTQVEMVVTI